MSNVQQDELLSHIDALGPWTWNDYSDTVISGVLCFDDVAVQWRTTFHREHGVDEDGTLPTYSLDVRAFLYSALVVNSERAPLLEGFLRWDGCLNLTVPDDSYWHFCGPEKDPVVGRVFKAIYALGPKMTRWMYEEPEL